MNFHRLLWVVCLCSVSACAQTRADLVPNPEFRVDPMGKPIPWQFWSPRPDLEPRASVASDPEGVTLKLAAVDFSSRKIELRTMMEEKFSWDKNVERLVEIYEELI